MSQISAAFKSARPPFLILTPVSVLLGLASALGTSTELHTGHLLLVLTGALAAHISVNALNEYFDFKSGLDALTTKTPFSGGSGSLIEQPNAATAVAVLGIGCLALVVTIGLYFSYVIGWPILAIGLVGVAIIVTYTQWINRSALLCLIAPGLGFGPLMVSGTHLVLAGSLSPTATYTSMLMFFLSSNLLLLNQLPDIEPDKSVGRRHFPIVYGAKRSCQLYLVFALAACLVIVSGVAADALPTSGLLALLPMLLTLAAYAGVSKQIVNMRRLAPYLGMNVAATLLTPTTLALCILVA